MLIQMNNYDNDVIGVGNSLHPANQIDCERELTHQEQMEEQIFILEQNIQQIRNAIKYRKAFNAKIIEIIKSVHANDHDYLHNKLNELM